MLILLLCTASSASAAQSRAAPVRLPACPHMVPCSLARCGGSWLHCRRSPHHVAGEQSPIQCIVEATATQQGLPFGAKTCSAEQAATMKDKYIR